MNAFSNCLERHRSRVALVQESGREISYEELLDMANDFLEQLGAGRKLVFLEAQSNPRSIAAYVGCLLGGHPVYPFQKAQEEMLERLVGIYRPHIVVHSDGSDTAIVRHHDDPANFHADLRVLLSTSGSTGSPKFVKLSERNVYSNARSIAEYLEIDETERAVTTLKFNYSYGMSVVNSHLISGASLLLTDHSVSEHSFWSLFRERGATSFAGVPFTFEALLHMEEELKESTGLRYATQAGGRLAPNLVRHFAQLGRTQGWRFYVMYGQTEAAPRIAYLPPLLAEDNPGAIGRAIPGGTIEIVDDDGLPIVAAGQPGELAYSGPNVMMGYAESGNELSSDETPQRLLTGDIAQWNEAGLVEIVGRAARFVKPFGFRVNLDEVEAELTRRIPSAACTGNDSMIVIGVARNEGQRDELIVKSVADRYRLPKFLFQVIRFDEVPRLPNGKVAYNQMMERATASHPATVALPRTSFNWTLARNQVITLLVSGLWHGPAWTFISWGAFHGIMLVAQRQVGRFFRRIPWDWESWAWRAVTIPAQILLVFILVAFSRILFRADDLGDAVTIIGKIVQGPYDWDGLGGKATIAICFAIIAAVLTAEVAVEAGMWRRRVARRRVLRTGLALIVLLATVAIGEFQGGRFIYVQF